MRVTFRCCYVLQQTDIPPPLHPTPSQQRMYIYLQLDRKYHRTVSLVIDKPSSLNNLDPSKKYRRVSYALKLTVRVSRRVRSPQSTVHSRRSTFFTYRIYNIPTPTLRYHIIATNVNKISVPPTTCKTCKP